MKPGKKKRGLSVGTVFVLTLMFLVIGGSVWTLTRLSGGSVNLEALTGNVLSLGKRNEDPSADVVIRTENGGRTGNAAGPSAESADAGGSDSSSSGGNSVIPTAAPSQHVTLSVSGIIAIEDAVRKSAYASDTEKYDFADMMMLMRRQFRNDLNIVFLENILSDEKKVSTVVVPEAAADMLKEAGITAVACGFAKAWEKGAEGAAGTRKALTERGLLPFGIQENGEAAWRMAESQGMRIALIQYTENMASGTRKSMEKAGLSAAVPQATEEQLAKDIAEARAQGADAVLVLVSWGKVGAKTPTKAQKELATRLAAAGADLIIGAGARIPQTAEMLTVEREGKSREVLCVYSTGTLLSDSRSSTARLAGYLVRITLRRGTDGNVNVDEMDYTPTYAWRFRQDSKYYYRCLAADEAAPDGMDADQQKAMERVRTYVDELLEGTPLAAAGG